ncbi:MAG: response regulator [Candidatus Dadabacteria bacterium]|nr:MAG: response regulator [Candidatus Dadabacteria bacterium]
MSAVLVVDDVRVNRLMLVKGLAPLPAIEAEDAAEALRLFFEQQPAVVILDLGLPEVDGVTLLRIIRQHDRRLGQETPVIVVSGEGTREHVVELARLGIHGFFVKPVNPAKLAEKVRELWPGAREDEEEEEGEEAEEEGEEEAADEDSEDEDGEEGAEEEEAAAE